MRLFPRFKHLPAMQHSYHEKQTEVSKEALIAGRRHRVDVPYVLPKDMQEISRLDFQHYALRALLNSDYRAPLHTLNPRAILDVGCGMGRWCRELAGAFPRSQVTAVNIEPQTPSQVLLPKTMHIVQADVLKGLPFAEASFDYVHQRLLVAAVPAANWLPLLRELLRVTRLGGWIELLEAGTFEHIGEATRQYMRWWEQVAPRLGFDPGQMKHLGALLEQAGGKKLCCETVTAPLGAWGGRAGELLGVDLHAVMRSCKGVFSA